MKLYLIRHATAKDVGENGIKTDLERPLNKKGVSEAKRVSNYISKVNIPINLMLYSPALRCVQTAEVISKGNKIKAKEVEDLSPYCSVDSYLGVIRRNIDIENLAIVGHNPTISNVLSSFLSTDDSPSLTIGLKKGAFACIDTQSVLSNLKKGILLFLVSPKYLPKN